MTTKTTTTISPETKTTALYIIDRGLPSRGKRWQWPGYVAIVRAPSDWDETRPLSRACMAKDGVDLLWSRNYADRRYRGSRSDYGQANAAAAAELDRIKADEQ